MTVNEAAKQLECSPKTIYELCAAGHIAHRRVGVGRGRIRIDQSDIDVYIAETRVDRVIPARRGVLENDRFSTLDPIGKIRAGRKQGGVSGGRSQAKRVAPG